MAIQLEDIILRIITDFDGAAVGTEVDALKTKIEALSKVKLAEDFVKQTKEIEKEVARLVKLIDEETDALKKAELQSKLNSTTQKKQKESLEDFNDTTVKSISNITKYRDLLVKLRKEVDVDSKAFKDFTKEIDRQNDELKRIGNQAEETEGKFSKLFNKIPDSVKNFKVLGVSINDVAGFFGRFGAAATGVVGAIGAIIAVPLAAYFTQTEEGADKLQRTLAGLRGRFDAVVGVAANVGKIFTNVFNQSFSETLRQIGREVAGIGDEMSRAAQAAQELFDLNIEIEEQEIRLVEQSARLRRLAKEANDITEDTSKSDAVRLEAAKAQVEFIARQGEIERELLIFRRDAVEAEIEASVALNATRAERLKLAEANAQIDLNDESIQERLTTAINKINIILDQRAAKSKALTDELQKQLDLLNKQVEAVEFSLLDDLGKLEFQRNKALEDIDRLKTDIEAAAAKAGKEIDISKDIQRLVDNVNNEFNKSLQELFAPSGEPLELIYNANFKARIANRKALQDNIETSISNLLDELELGGAIDLEKNGLIKIPEPEDFKDNILKPFLNESLDIGEADLDLSFSDKISDALISIGEDPEIKQTLENGLAAAKDFAEQLLESRISALDEALERQRNVIDELVEAETLGGQKQLQAAKEREAELQAEREKAIANQQRLAAIQVAIDQASAIASGTRAVASAFANGGPLAIPLGIATGAALAAQIALLVANIGNLFGSIPSFDVGTNEVGAPKANHVTDGKGGTLAMVHKGEMIPTAKESAKIRALGVGHTDLAKYVQMGKMFESGLSLSTIPFQTASVTVNQKDSISKKEFKKLLESNENIYKALSMLGIEFNVTEKGLNAAVTKYKKGKKKSRSKMN